jgi:hypothetical protein
MTDVGFWSMLVLGLLMTSVLIFGTVVKRQWVRLWKSVPMQLHKIRTALILYAFRGSSISEGLIMAKKFNLRRSMNKDIIYGALLELSQNKQVWYESSVNPEYSKLTEDGREAIIHVIEDMFRGLQTIHNQEVKEEAKRQTMESLRS